MSYCFPTNPVSRLGASPPHYNNGLQASVLQVRHQVLVMDRLCGKE